MGVIDQATARYDCDTCGCELAFDEVMWNAGRFEQELTTTWQCIKCFELSCDELF
jgi:hypothetical protein